MGFFSGLDAEIKYSLLKPEGSKLTREDLIIRLRQCYINALKLQVAIEDNPEASEIDQAKAMRDQYIKTGDGYFYKLMK